MESIISKLPNRRQFISGFNTIEIGYPWITENSIIFLESVLKENFKVFECGCGGSTVFYSKRCQNVISFETDKIWFEKVSNLCLKNVEIKLLENTQDFLHLINFFDDNSFDIISVDSNPTKTKRLDLVKALIPKIKKFGFLVLDNYFAFGNENFIRPENSIEYIFDDHSWVGKGTKIIQLK